MRKFPWQNDRKSKKDPVWPSGGFVENRARHIILIFLGLFLILGVRSIWLQVFPPSPKDLNRLANRQYLKEVKLSPYRGSIYDRRGDPLAISIRKPSLFINPRVFNPSRGEIKKLAALLSTSRSYIRKKAERKSYFAWLKRKVDQKTFQKVMNMKLDGLFDTSEPARFYPGKRSAANLIGYVNIDDVGMAGLEQQFNSVLQGDSSKLRGRKDARGHIIFHEGDEATPEKPGRNVKLTIDRAIQEIAMNALSDGIKKAKAKGGMAIVSDPHTGKILAIANSPTFEPNSRRIKIKNTRNYALQDSFEPGSIIKTFVVAEALERKIVSPNTKLDCENGVYKAGGVTFRDSHKPETKYLTVQEIFTTSSNVCTFKIAEKLGQKVLYNSYQKLGFGKRFSDISYPAQSFGYLSHWKKWKPIRFANLAFGQGLLMTGLEVVQAFGAIANGGVMIKPQLVSATENQDGTWTYYPSQKMGDVFNQSTTNKMKTMMKKVVEDGAIKARMSQYTAGGKTGTSQKIDPKTKGYSKEKYWALFAGLAPVKDPHLVIFVMVDEPHQKQHYGSLWAAPIFKEIAEKSLNYLNVTPDKLLATEKKQKQGM